MLLFLRACPDTVFVVAAHNLSLHPLLLSIPITIPPDNSPIMASLCLQRLLL